MKIDISKIDGFQTMSAEEQVKALLALEIENGDMDKLKAALNKATGEASNYKKQLNEKLSEEERKAAAIAEERKKEQEELATLRRDKAISDNVAKLLGVGYDEALARKSAEAIADGDFAALFANMSEFNTKREQLIREQLINGTPKPAGGSGNAVKTREEILNIKDATERQEAMAANPELFGIE